MAWTYKVEKRVKEDWGGWYEHFKDETAFNSEGKNRRNNKVLGKTY